jgi:hypothetical protein
MWPAFCNILSMTAQFNIEIDLNGWLVPIRVEGKGSGIFKVAYGDTTLGLLVQNESSHWLYTQDLFSTGCLNALTSEKISQAIDSLH